jgi:exodeoxyribonuclease-5
MHNELKLNPYYNALQIKFAYAITCHKAQGGQWDAVFVDQGYVTDEMINMDFLRWFYTAVTRATTELFLVNFDNRFYKVPEVF